MRIKILILATALLLPMLAGAQAQINTKKFKIGDFTEKTTKIVLSGNDFYDSCLKDEISARWRISPYEFCTLEEFDALKKDQNLYFLLTTKGQFKKETEPGLRFLTLIKGGLDAENGINDMLEIVSMPLSSAEDPSGRELVILPIFIDIIQQYTLDSMEKDINAYGGLANYSINITSTKDMSIIFAEEDLSDRIDDTTKSAMKEKDIEITDEESADEFFTKNASSTLVSYTVYPSDRRIGSYCYKMLIDAQTYELYYFKKHRITKKNGPGFLKEDLLRIMSIR